MSGSLACPVCDSPVAGRKVRCEQCGLVPDVIEPVMAGIDVERPEAAQEVEMLLETLEKLESINEDVLIERQIGRAHV